MSNDELKDTMLYMGYGIYLGRREDSSNRAELDARGITHVFSLGKENAPERHPSRDINYYLFDIGERGNSDWSSVFDNDATSKFLKSFRRDKENRLLVHCRECLIRSPFAVRCILIKYYNFTPFQARVYTIAIHPPAYANDAQLKTELSLCKSRQDKENDFGLRQHFLTKSKAPEDKKRPEFALKSLYTMDDDFNTRVEQLMADGRYELAPLLDADKLEELKNMTQLEYLKPNKNLKPAEKHIIPFIDFEGILQDEVPLAKCTLFKFKAYMQYFPIESRPHKKVVQGQDEAAKSAQGHGTLFPSHNLLYIGYGIYHGRKGDANNHAELKARKISHIFTLGKKNTPTHPSGNIQYHTFDISDGHDSDWLSIFQDVATLRFLDDFLKNKANRLMVHCSDAFSVLSPFAIRGIFIRYFKYTPFQARIRIVDIKKDYRMYPSMLEAELSLCSREDKGNDFGLREHVLAKSQALDDAKVSEFAQRSLFAIVHSEAATKAQREVDDGERSLSEFLQDNGLKELRDRDILNKCKLRPSYGWFLSVGESVVPFINFDGCVQDRVQVEKCTLFEFQGRRQCFPYYIPKKI